MPQKEEQLVGNEALERVLEELKQTVVTFEETSDPSDPDVIDEYERLLAVMYQALSDAQAVTAQASEAAALASRKAGDAEAAAGVAMQKAGYAQDKGDYAKEQGDYAKEQGDYAKRKADDIEDAKGDYDTLSARLSAIETDQESDVKYEESDDPMSLFEEEDSSGN